MTRKRFEKILMAIGFERNMLDAVAKKAISCYGSYQNAIDQNYHGIGGIYMVGGIWMPREFTRRSEPNG